MAEPAAARQLPLAFPHRSLLLEADFLPGPGNREALRFLAECRSWPQGRLALWGGRGCGKTHLLHIWARRCGAALLDGADLAEPHWPPGPIAIDDVDRAPSEAALLHLLNGAAEAGQPVLMTTAAPPGRLPVGIPDLASRLRATVAVEIGPPDEAFLAGLLDRLLAGRQLRLAPGLHPWLLTRLPRTPEAVREAVERLDRAALAAGSAVTRRLAADALDDLFREEDAPASPEAPRFGYPPP